MFGGRVVNHRGLQLFRAMFPSWRFFDDIGHSSLLFYRVGSSECELESSPWLAALERARRGWGSLWLNPHGGFLFACHSLIEQAVNDLEDWDAGRAGPFEESVSFQLVKKLVLFQLRRNEHARASGAPLRYQFKLVSIPPPGMSLDLPDRAEDLLISGVYSHPEEA